jgi:hypothetical protein
VIDERDMDREYAEGVLHCPECGSTDLRAELDRGWPGRLRLVCRHCWRRWPQEAK